MKINIKNEPSIKEESLIELTNEDIAKIAERISEMTLQTENKTLISSNTNNSEKVCSFGVLVDKKPETVRTFLDFGVDRLGVEYGTNGECVPEDVARCIDHTILKPDATEDDIIKLCAEAHEFQFASVCVSPSYVPLSAHELAGSQG